MCDDYTKVGSSNTKFVLVFYACYIEIIPSLRGVPVCYTRVIQYKYRLGRYVVVATCVGRDFPGWAWIHWRNLTIYKNRVSRSRLFSVFVLVQQEDC